MSERFSSGGSSVRDGRPAPVTCAVCGCRLREAASTDVDARWFHFSPLGGRDARGCRVSCVEQAHNVSGRSISIAYA